jgi:hypothetical protein
MAIFIEVFPEVGRLFCFSGRHPLLNVFLGMNRQLIFLLNGIFCRFLQEVAAAGKK